MAQIEYIGQKARKEDNVAGTGVVWFGQGDVRAVPDTAVGKLLEHTGVWRLAPEVGGLASLPPAAADQPDAAGPTETTEPPKAAAAPEPARFVLDGPDGTVALDALDDAALRAWIEEHFTPHGIKIDGRLKGDKLRAAIIEAVKADSAGA